MRRHGTRRHRTRHRSPRPAGSDAHGIAVEADLDGSVAIGPVGLLGHRPEAVDRRRRRVAVRVAEPG
jgi:hypothetical protein